MFFLVVTHGLFITCEIRDRRMRINRFVTKPFKQRGDLLGAGFGGNAESHAQFTGTSDAPCEGLAVCQRAQSGGRFQRVAEGVAQIEQGAFAGSLFRVFFDNAALVLDRPRQQRDKRLIAANITNAGQHAGKQILITAENGRL